MKHSFGEFVLDTDLEILLEGSSRTPLTPQQVRVLKILFEKRGKTVSRQAILQEVWPDDDKDPHNLDAAISAIRKTLKDDQTTHRYIHTFYRKGYRFIYEDPRDIRVTTSSKATVQSAAHKPLLERLYRCGVPVNQNLREESVQMRLSAKWVIGDVILEVAFGGWHGITTSELKIANAVHSSPRLPDYIYDRRRRTPEPPYDKQFVYLEGWEPGIIDKRDIVTLHLGCQDDRVPDGKYDYWTTSAVIDEILRLQHEILSGQRILSDFGRRLDVTLSVVTADGQLVVVRRSKSVSNAQSMWMTSVGESVDPKSDVDEHGVLQPIATVHRCLWEHDELNLSKEHASSANVRLLGIATEWQYMYANILALVELPTVTFQQLKDRWLPGEHGKIARVSFTLDSCLSLVEKGFKDPDVNDHAEIEGTSRMTLLLSLIHKFGYEEVEARIAANQLEP
jgi:DNA-binding winged helix-turn-helix (wHTH) protein